MAPSRPDLPRYSEIESKTILRESHLVDPWFIGKFGANLYRGCEHACIYCDGRAERYYVEGDFARDIQVKINSVALVRRELARRREPGFLFVGGGVSDSYQPAEAHYCLARGLLEATCALGIPVHILTKSALVERDFDLLQELHRKSQAILSFSLQTTDESVRERFEPGAAPIARRFELLGRARRLGLSGGIMAMPVLPGISDKQDQLDDLAKRALDAGAQFICFGGLTLRPGRQKELYFKSLEAHYPELFGGYARAYGRNLPSGTPDPRYLDKIQRRFGQALVKVGLPSRIPRALFQGLVPRYTEASVLLEHLEIASQITGPPRRLAKSGFAIAKWAKARWSKEGRRRGFSYREIEQEFASLLKSGTLREVIGVSEEAERELRHLGFET